MAAPTRFCDPTVSSRRPATELPLSPPLGGDARHISTRSGVGRVAESSPTLFLGGSYLLTDKSPTWDIAA